jgi:hypothetical protein
MILLTLIAAAALQAPQAAAYPSQTSPATAESVEILRRLLVEGLERVFDRKDEKKDTFAFREDGMAVNGFVTTLWAGNSTVQHSRAFHVPESGVFLALDAALPLVAREEVVPEDDEPEVAGDDEWERIRRELKGGAAGSPEGSLYRRLRISTPRQDLEIDPRAIDQVVDAVLQTVARHGVRVEGLGQHDAITVALRITGKSRMWTSDVHPDAPDLFSTTIEPPKQPGKEINQGNFATYVLSAQHAEVKPQNLVIRIAVADLAGQPSAERLRQRARINRY